MKEGYKFIFDLDGTLYRFDKGTGDMFTSSRFYGDLKNKVYDFFMEKRGISREEAMSEYERIKDTYNDEISLGVEKEYGIDRYEFFNNTWNLPPQNYLEKDTNLPKQLEQIRGRLALLTAAPRIWALNVLAHLKIEDVFEGNMYTGEPDERKPNPLIFQKIADDFCVSPQMVFSIGDQEYSDIIPAKSIGMKTIFIGKRKNNTADYTAENVTIAIDLLRNEGFL